jgi:uncharacterized membrane protein YfcA
MGFILALATLSLAAGGIASLAGFGIGSLMTPLLSLKTGIGVAVAAVSLAHLCGTALRCFLLRKSIDRRVLLSFGSTSAAGGLAGALLHNYFQNGVLTVIFGCLLILAGTSELAGLPERLSLKGGLVWLAGGASGLFGGLVGNQGGIRSAALLGFHLGKNEFVATATGIALMVDLARVPVYLAVQSQQIASIWEYVVVMTAGVVIGTLAGKRVLEMVPERFFKKIVGAIILLVGILMLVER